MSNIEQIAELIDQTNHSELDLVQEFVKARRKVLRERRSATNLVAVQPGEKVTLTGLSPKYLNGLTVTVKSVTPDRKVEVEFDDGWDASQARARFGDSVRVPGSSIVRSDG